MRDFRDAKAMAQTLRSAIAPKGLTLTHSECLEITARILGAKDWNVLAALIENSATPIPEASGRVASDRWAGPLLHARDVVLFPKETVPLYIARDMSKQAVAEAGRGGLEVLVVAQKNYSYENPGREGIFDVGVVADVLDMAQFTPVGAPPNSAIKLTLRGRQRARLIEVVDEGGGLRAEARLIRNEPGDVAAAAEKVRAAIEAFQASADGLPHLPSHDLERRSRVMARMGSITRPDALADMIAQWAPGSVAQKQQVLETLEPLARLDAAVALLRLASAPAA